MINITGMIVKLKKQRPRTYLKIKPRRKTLEHNQPQKASPLI